MDSNSPQNRKDPAQELGSGELLRFGEFIYTLVYLLAKEPFPLSPSVVASNQLQKLFTQESPNMLQVGEYMLGLFFKKKTVIEFHFSTANSFGKHAATPLTSSIVASTCANLGKERDGIAKRMLHKPQQS